MTKAVLYARVSSKEQAEEGYSIEAQQRFLRDYAAEHDLEIEREFVEVESAKQSGRHAFNEMVAFIRKNAQIKTVLCEKTDRLYRNFHDYVTLDLEQQDLTLILAKEGEILNKDSKSHQKLVHGLKVLLAKNYIDNLREESAKGMREKAEQGEFPQQAPLGYLNNKETKLIYTDDSRAPLIRRLYELYATGKYSLDNVLEKITEEGLTTKSGKKLACSQVHRVLKNPIYYGWFMWKGQMYKGVHSPIITKELFDIVQNRFNRANHKQEKRTFPYTGLLTCAKCGCSITAESKKGKYIYYHCTWHKGDCGNGYISQEDLESRLGDLIKKIVISNDRLEWFKRVLLESHEDEKQYHNDAVDKLKAEHKQLQILIDKAYQDKLKGVIDARYWIKLSNEWKERQASVLDALRRHQKANGRYFDAGVRILELCGRAYEMFKVREPHEKRELLRFVLSNCQLDGKNLIPTYRKPFDIFAKGSSCPNWLPEQYDR